MNFIVEFLPKKANESEIVYVVRSPQGFPIGVCDTLEEATDLMRSKFDEMRKTSNGNA